MANTTSAKKAKRVAERRRVFNTRRKKEMKDTLKSVSKLIASKSADAAAMLPKLQKAIDKAAKSNIIAKNTAARIKSRIAKRISALTK